MRLPVAAKMALHTAGIAGGSAGSPMPVGEWSVWRKCTSAGRALTRGRARAGPYFAALRRTTQATMTASFRSLRQIRLRNSAGWMAWV